MPVIRTATPISSGPNHMTFLMRIFPNTEIGRFLSNLQVADEVSVYGPLPSRVAFSANDGIASLVTSARVSQSDLAQSEQVNLKCSSVVLLAQGTGITTCTGTPENPAPLDESGLAHLKDYLALQDVVCHPRHMDTVRHLRGRVGE